ncbi:MAG: hypothetical protein IPJ27_20895 [Candidatus Accumulibacter sp.]|uniref:Exonuclease domain-containing protein n=1 Tax=Candidatus Accumulibacter proximus TaxID=2954385 RepID=A0A935Q321_9PROT|nr:hypothetical protein [Candidatus Accumulibacter proximus]
MDLTYTVFDTETTGLEPAAGTEIIRLAPCVLSTAVCCGKRVFDELVDPQCFLRPKGIGFTASPTTWCVDCRRSTSVLPTFHDFCGDTVLMAHNAAFDITLPALKEPQTSVVFSQPKCSILYCFRLCASCQPGLAPTRRHP